ncbi:MAG: hypothetical protein QOF71_1787, partial [Candidatus Eremiobacteraeota bacterium]|nr:hypothetical protein [Candidatus Eremiobacteraeota bacterium]
GRDELVLEHAPRLFEEPLHHQAAGRAGGCGQHAVFAEHERALSAGERPGEGQNRAQPLLRMRNVLERARPCAREVARPARIAFVAGNSKSMVSHEIALSLPRAARLRDLPRRVVFDRA